MISRFKVQRINGCFTRLDKQDMNLFFSVKELNIQKGRVFIHVRKMEGGRGGVSRYTSLVKWCSLSLCVSVRVRGLFFLLSTAGPKLPGARIQVTGLQYPPPSLYVKLVLAHSQPTVTACRGFYGYV